MTTDSLQSKDAVKLGMGTRPALKKGGMPVSLLRKRNAHAKSRKEALAEPASHKFEELFDLPFGVDEYADGKKRVSMVPAHIIVGAVSFLCKVLWRYQAEGNEKLFKLTEDSGAVIVSNHTSYLDVVFMYLSIYPQRWPRFMARDTLFEANSLLGWAIAHVGAFPVKRDTADRTSVKRAARMLKNGEIVGIMPEGSRRGKGSAKPRVHGGAALVARMGKAPIMPMAVHNVDKIKRKGERLRFPKVTIEFGDPIWLKDFDFLPKDERLDGCVWYALRECFALFNGVKPEDVDMVALFPDDKDFTQEFAQHPIPRHTIV